MTYLLGNTHIPPVCPKETQYSYFYGRWLKRFNWTYILTLRRHFPYTESACHKLAQKLLHYSSSVKTIWLALEKDRGDNMNHLHVILETESLILGRADMIEALGIQRNPKNLSYYSAVDSSDSVAMYCTKRIGGRAIHHDFYTQLNRE